MTSCYIQEYFPYGPKKIRYEYYQNCGKKEGVYKEYYENGNLYKELNYIDGKKNGISKVFKINHILSTDYYYENNNIMYYNKYYPNGNIELSYDCVNNKYKEYYEKGNIKLDINAHYDSHYGIDKNIKNYFIKDGEYKQYYKNGKLFEECNYKDNKLNGMYREYRNNGIIKKEMIYQDGIRNGFYKLYDNQGELIHEFYYINDKINGLHKIYKNTKEGRICEERLYVDDILIKN